jgi:ELWxxDGT repeat protein
VTGRSLRSGSPLFDQVTIALARADGQPAWTHFGEARAGSGLLHARLMLTPDESLAIVTGSQGLPPAGCAVGDYALILGISTGNGELLRRDLWGLDCATGPQDHTHDAVLTPDGDRVLAAVHRGIGGGQALTVLSLDGTDPGAGGPPGGGVDPVDPTAAYTTPELAGDDDHSHPDHLVDAGGTLFFTIQPISLDNFYPRLHRIDDSMAMSTLVKDFLQNPALEEPTYVNGLVFFRATGIPDPFAGSEPWKSDGTLAGTVMVQDIRPGGQDGIDLSFDPSLVPIGGVVLFPANDAVNGNELWESNGTGAGTLLVADIPGAIGVSSNPRHLTAVGETLYFSAEDGVRDDGSGGPRRRLYRVRREAVVEPPPDPESPLLVRCLHSPILPQAGQPLTITAEALTGDILGTSTTALEADEIEIWIDDADGRSLRAVDQHVDTLAFETTAVPLPPSFMMSYAYRVRLGDQVLFSGWRQTSTITLTGATPLIYTSPASEHIDVVFIADDGTYSGSFGSQFHADIVELIRKGFYDSLSMAGWEASSAIHQSQRRQRMRPLQPAKARHVGAPVRLC